jgi:mannose-6-phosphate isomerase-like protein (cupin superfamily)
MPPFQRRNLLSLPLLTLPISAHATPPIQNPGELPNVVPAGQDREHKPRAIGISATTYKVLTRETAGSLFVLEQKNHTKGGPPRHLHHNEDELFFVVEGEYDVEIAGHRASLKQGDCILGPKGLPHAWAYVGNSVGRLLLSYAPAGKMEAFFAETAKRTTPGKYTAGTPSGDAVMRAFGMEYIGPPLKIT